MLMAVAAIGVCSADFDDNKPASRRSNILMTVTLRKIETLSDDDRKFSIAMQRWLLRISNLQPFKLRRLQ